MSKRRDLVERLRAYIFAAALRQFVLASLFVLKSFGIMHKVEWFEIKINEKKFVNYVTKVIDLLSSDKIPISEQGCSFCDYTNQNL